MPPDATSGSTADTDSLLRPVAVRGERVYVIDEEGNRYLDAAGGGGVVTIGHGVRSVADAVGTALRELPFVHGGVFDTPQSLELAAMLSGSFPGPEQDADVIFTSGGSEATEVAIATARRYWAAKGEPARQTVLGRWHGYHGGTAAAQTLSGNRAPRQAYAATEVPLAAPCYCYRCPFDVEFPFCEVACAHDLEETIRRAGPETVAAFICEPIVGETSGAVPPPTYLKTIRDICDTHGILFIADETLTGGGRTGQFFAIEHWDVVPDMLIVGGGLASGYAPLGALLVSEKVSEEASGADEPLEPTFTYQAHPPSVAAGLAVQQYLERHELIARAPERGEYLTDHLAPLNRIARVGEIRGQGLLRTIELVADKSKRTPIPPESLFVERLFEKLRHDGVIVHAVRGTIDGTAGEHLMLAPPFVITEAEIDRPVHALEDALRSTSM